jgi:hypothetical protein
LAKGGLEWEADSLHVRAAELQDAEKWCLLHIERSHFEEAANE